MPVIDGRIKFFKKDRGYGFVTVPGWDRDVFLHVSCLARGGFDPEAIADGDQITFEWQQEPRGLAVIRIESIGSQNGRDVLEPVTLKWYDRKKNFGFVKRQSGEPDAFLHKTALDTSKIDPAALAEGQHLLARIGPSKFSKVSKKRVEVLELRFAQVAAE